LLTSIKLEVVVRDRSVGIPPLTSLTLIIMFVVGPFGCLLWLLPVQLLTSDRILAEMGCTPVLATPVICSATDHLVEPIDSDCC
jgi:hypothetical protein